MWCMVVKEDVEDNEDEAKQSQRGFSKQASQPANIIRSIVETNIRRHHAMLESERIGWLA